MFSAFKSTPARDLKEPPPSAPSTSGPNFKKTHIVDPYIAFLFAQTGGNVDFLWSAGCLGQKDHLKIKSTLHSASVAAQDEASSAVRSAEEVALAAKRAEQPNSLGLVSDRERQRGSNNAMLYEALSERDNMEEVISTALRFVPGLPSLYSLMIRKSVGKYSKEIAGTLTNPVLQKVITNTGPAGWKATKEFMTKSKAEREAVQRQKLQGSTETAEPAPVPVSSQSERQRDRLLRTAVSLQAAADELRALAAELAVHGEEIPDETVNAQADRIMAMAMSDGPEATSTEGYEERQLPPPPRRQDQASGSYGNSTALPPPPPRRNA